MDHPYKKLEYGKWELYIPPREDGACAIAHLSEIKVIVRNSSDQLVDRLSPWAKYVVQPPKEANQGTNYKQRVWHPPAHEVSQYVVYCLFVRLLYPKFFCTHFRSTCLSIANQLDLNR